MTKKIIYGALYCDVFVQAERKDMQTYEIEYYKNILQKHFTKMPVLGINGSNWGLVIRLSELNHHMRMSTYKMTAGSE